MFQNLLNTLQTFLASGIGSIIKALLLLILAFVVAAVVRTLLQKLFKIEKVGNLLAKADGENEKGGTANFISKLAYLLTFLLFVPGIMSALRADSIAQPILNILNTIWGYVPNILAAVIVLIVGFFIARLVRQLLVPVFQKINVDKLQDKAGIKVNDSGKLSNTLAYIVYVLILIPVIIVALQVLNIKAISDPAVGMLNTIFDKIPAIIVAALIIGIGCLIGKFAGQIVTRLIATTGADAKVREYSKAEKFSLSKVIGVIVSTIIIIFFTVEGINVLGLKVLSSIGTSVIAYLPKVLAAVIILILAVLATKAVEAAMKKTGLASYTLIVRIAIFTIAAFMILNQLGIASKIVDSAFIIILAALAVAFAVAFGIGGRDFAANTLKKLEEKNAKDKASDEN
ncbi:MAG: mechanosensitive ion channel [Lachnospiraceae bacterium]|nr:mechanosensitive ion channel [Lachnospiraceae bacterium]